MKCILKISLETLIKLNSLATKITGVNELQFVIADKLDAVTKKIDNRTQLFSDSQNPLPMGNLEDFFA